MVDKNKEKSKDISTETSIKNAARKVFHQKGFAATRTRDIAETAGINLALLNYYFRSKQKLFDIIMMETMMQFMQSVLVVFHDETTTLEEKIESISHGYINLLADEPNIPVFIMNELRSGHVPHFFSQFNMKEKLLASVFFRQYQEAVDSKKFKNVPFIHFFMNLLGLCVFPFIASPIVKTMEDINDAQFRQLMIVRKKYISGWVYDMCLIK